MTAGEDVAASADWRDPCPGCSAELSDVARLWRARRDLGPHPDPRYRPNQRVGEELAVVLDRIAGADR